MTKQTSTSTKKSNYVYWPLAEGDKWGVNTIVYRMINEKTQKPQYKIVCPEGTIKHVDTFTVYEYLKGPSRCHCHKCTIKRNCQGGPQRKALLLKENHSKVNVDWKKVTGKSIPEWAKWWGVPPTTAREWLLKRTTEVLISMAPKE